MKNIDLINEQANSGDAKNLRVVFKKHNSMEDLIRQDPSTAQGGAHFESLTEKMQRIVEGAQRWFAALENRGDYLTYGMLTRIGGATILKVCILGIIMFIIFSDGLVFNVGKPIFAAANSKKEKVEKAHTDKQAKATTNHGTTSASLGSDVSFDLAPASAEELNGQSVKAYIERYSKIAVAEMDKFGIPASITMAQAIIESRSGKSALAVYNNNHFGIKCFSKSCAAGHCSNYTDDNHKDFFRKYANSTDSWREHSQFLMKNRYRDLLKFGKNYKVWARGLRDFGYATDQSYDKKLISVIERYELNKLDDL
jgi:flagellum-specific peptidoglycan hydrolase FlgJ